MLCHEKISQKKKSVALYGAGRFEQLGFAEALKSDPDGEDFNFISLYNLENCKKQLSTKPENVDLGRIVVFVVSTENDTDILEIRKMSESFFPRSIVLALQCPTIQFSPSAWPTNVRAVVRWDEMSERVGLFLSLISGGLAIFDTKIIKTSTLGEPGKSNGHNSIEAEPMQVLTRREMEVASEVYRGATNAIIAERLGIKVNTVNTHLNTLMRKLGKHNRTEVAVWYATFHKFPD